MSDLISREAVLKLFATHDGDYLYEAIRDMPAEQPEAKAPIWKEEDRFVRGYFTWYPYCPECDHEVVTGQCYCEICGQHIDWSEDDGRFNQQTGGD